MYKKRALVLGGYLSLLALAACGPKVIDDADIVSVDYKYSFSDGTLIEQGVKEFTVGENSDFKWMESIVRGAKQNDEFEGKINGMEIYSSEYNGNNVQSYPRIVMTEVFGVEDPSVGAEIEVNTLGKGVVKSIEKDTDGYDVYVVDFNNPKTYSELSYSLKVLSVEKN